MDEEARADVQRARQEMQVQTAINIVEGINTVETMALLGHWMRKKRPPTPAEAATIEHIARQRWALQVRQALAQVKADQTDLDEQATALADLMVKLSAPVQAKKGKGNGSGSRRPKPLKGSSRKGK